jgi:hypothetical protein
MDSGRITRLFIVSLTCMVWSASYASCGEPDGWRRIERDELCITTGSIRRVEDHLSIDGPEVRATLHTATHRAAEIRFTYLGPSAATAPLASGELRRQIGLKLRAQDTCNVVYVMWHIQPDARLVVAVKRNPGKRIHAECGAGGYTTIKPQIEVPLPPIILDSAHTLRAVLHANVVEAHTDGKLALSARIDQPALDFDGSVGLRTDNARFRFQFLVGGTADTGASPALDGRRNRCQD